MKKALPYGQHADTCPVRTLRDWLDALGETSGPVFRSITKTGKISERALSDRSVALIVKDSALKAGLDPLLYAGTAFAQALPPRPPSPARANGPSSGKAAGRARRWPGATSATPPSFATTRQGSLGSERQGSYSYPLSIPYTATCAGCSVRLSSVSASKR